MQDNFELWGVRVGDRVEILDGDHKGQLGTVKVVEPASPALIFVELGSETVAIHRSRDIQKQT